MHKSTQEDYKNIIYANVKLQTQISDLTHRIFHKTLEHFKKTDALTSASARLNYTSTVSKFSPPFSSFYSIDLELLLASNSFPPSGE